jgi:hypothetical protein
LNWVLQSKLVEEFNQSKATQQRPRIIKPHRKLSQYIDWLVDYTSPVQELTSTQRQLVTMVNGKVTLQQLKEYIASRKSTLQQLFSRT